MRATIFSKFYAINALVKGCILCILLLISSLSAIGQNISLQGVLRDPAGKSVDDGFYNVTFKIYTVASGGAALWSENYPSLQTRHGVFNVSLGTNTPLEPTLAFDQLYYVGVTVDPFTEMSPRLEVTIYPYAKSILGQDNKFPSIGDVEMQNDNFIIHEGELRLEGSGGLIRFNDGTTLNTANFGGPAGSLSNPSNAVINADVDTTGTGDIDFQIAGNSIGKFQNNGKFIAGSITTDSIVAGSILDNHLSINENSLQSWDGGSTVALNLNPSGGGILGYQSLELGASNERRGILQLYGDVTPGSTGGQLNLHTSAGQSVDKWYLETYANELNLGILTGGSFLNVVNFKENGRLSLGRNDMNFGIIDLYGDGTSSLQGGRIQFFKAADYDGDGSPTATDYWFMEATDDDFRIGNIFSNNNVLFLQGDGNIGINDGDPSEAKLVVRGGTFGADVDYRYINGGESDWISGTGYADYMSIYTDQNIVSKGLLIYSDERIKTGISKSSSKEDLDILNRISITNYEYIDKILHGHKQEKKVIAQEVFKIYPNAISKSKEVVPNIYSLATNIEYSELKGILTLELNKEHELKVGDIVKVYVDQGEILREVIEITKNGFSIYTEQNTQKAFVYGKQVDDFHTVDYDAIAMLNVSATQELAKRIEDLQKENADLKARLEKINDLDAKWAKLSELEAKLNKLLAPDAPSSEMKLGKE